MTMGDRIKRGEVVDNAKKAAGTQITDRSLQADGRAGQASATTMKQAGQQAKNGS